MKGLNVYCMLIDFAESDEDDCSLYQYDLSSEGFRDEDVGFEDESAVASFRNVPARDINSRDNQVGGRDTEECITRPSLGFQQYRYDRNDVSSPTLHNRPP